MDGIRVGSCFMWVLFWICVLYCLGCLGAGCLENFNFSMSVYVGSGVVGFFMLFMLVETAYCTENEYLRNLGKSRTVSESIQTLRRAPPSITWKVTCFHFEPRTIALSSTDAHGNAQTYMHTYQEKVTTHRVTEVFKFNYWWDDSEDTVKGIEKYRITRIKLQQMVEPGDEETQEEMRRRIQELQDRNRSRDEHMSFSEKREIPGFQERLSAYVDRSARPSCIGTAQLWGATLLGLTWPYRWYFQYNTGKTAYTISKKVYLSRPDVTSSGGHGVVAFSADAARRSEMDASANRNAPSAGRENRLTEIAVD